MAEKLSVYRTSRMKGALRYSLLRLGKLSLGLLALILLKVRGSRLAAPVNRNGGGVPTTRHLSGLVAAPAFTIAIIAFILLILLNTALSVVQAAA